MNEVANKKESITKLIELINKNEITFVLHEHQSKFLEELKNYTIGVDLAKGKDKAVKIPVPIKIESTPYGIGENNLYHLWKEALKNGN